MQSQSKEAMLHSLGSSNYDDTGALDLSGSTPVLKRNHGEVTGHPSAKLNSPIDGGTQNTGATSSSTGGVNGKRQLERPAKSALSL